MEIKCKHCREIFKPNTKIQKMCKTCNQEYVKFCEKKLRKIGKITINKRNRAVLSAKERLKVS